MLADSMFDHVGIGRDHERRVLQEQEQPYRFEGGNGGWWKAPVEIVDEHDQSDTEFFQGFLKGVSQCLDFLGGRRSEEHTSELQSLMRISYAVFCLKKKKIY